MYQPGDKVVAVRNIKTKHLGADTIEKDTEGIIHWCDPIRAESAVLFVGHMMAYRIKSEDIRHA